jgi:hypothetical protein
MKRFALFLVISVVVCGSCFGQDNPQSATTRQVSNGPYSPNISGVRGNVNIEFNITPCNGSSESFQIQLQQFGESLLTQLDARRSNILYSTNTMPMAGPFLAPTDLSGDTQALPKIQSLLEFPNAMTPINLSSMLTAQTIGISSDALAFRFSDRELGGTPINSSNLVFPVTSLLQPSDALSNLASGEHITGLGPQPANLIFPAVFTGGLFSDSLSVAMATPPLVFSSITGGVDYLQSWKTLSGQALGVAEAQGPIGPNLPGILMDGVGVPRSGSLVPPGIETIGLTFNTSFTSISVSSISVVTGGDYESLTRRLADLKSNGHTITGWTLTYAMDGTQ